MLSEATIPLPGGKVKGGGGGFFAANAYLPGSPGRTPGAGGDRHSPEKTEIQQS